MGRNNDFFFNSANVFRIVWQTGVQFVTNFFRKLVKTAWEIRGHELEEEWRRVSGKA